MKVYICVISSMEYNKEYNTIEPVQVASSFQALLEGSKKNAPKLVRVNVYAIIIVLCISIDNSNIRTRSLRNTHSQETQHLSWETL
jgi:hypothetical protein